MTKKHSLRPKLKRKPTWRCSCGVINLASAAKCKMIRINAERLRIVQRDALSRNLTESNPEQGRLRSELIKHIDDLIDRGK